ILATASGCWPRTAAPPAVPLRQVVLPDLSGVADSVKGQARALQNAVNAAVASPAATAAQRATAFADLGRLLLAAEWPGAAGTCFGNAELLAPGDARWPYYRGHAF